MATAFLINKLIGMLADMIIEDVNWVCSFKDDFKLLCENLAALECLLTELGERWHSASVSKWIESLEDIVEDGVEGKMVGINAARRHGRAGQNFLCPTSFHSACSDFDSAVWPAVSPSYSTTNYYLTLAVREKVLVPRSKPFVTFIGDDARQPVITGNDTAAAIGMDGLPMKTFRSATVAVNFDYFIAYRTQLLIQKLEAMVAKLWP